MAQAPSAPASGAPRQNKTVKQFSGMNTQNRRNAIPEGSFAWLENIQPIGPGNLHSIPGRSTQVTLIPPFIPPVGPCIPIAPDGMSEVAVLFDTGIGSAVRFTWSFIEDNPGGEIVYEAATNIPFPSLEQMYKSTNDVTTTDTYPDGVNGMSNAAPGIADRVLFANSSGGGFYVFDLSDNSQKIFNLSTPGLGSNIRNWSVAGDILFAGGNDTSSGGDLAILKYQFSTQLFIDSLLIDSITSIQSFHYNGQYLYVLVQHSGTTFSVLKYDTDFVLLDTFALTPVADGNHAYIAIYAESDDIIYVLRRNITGPMGTVAGISYVHNISQPGATQVVLDDTIQGSSFALDGGAWVMIAHTDETTGEKYFYLGRQTQSSIFKYGFAICAS